MTEAELAELRKNMADYFSGEIGKSLFAHKIIDLLNHIERQQKAIEVLKGALLELNGGTGWLNGLGVANQALTKAEAILRGEDENR